MDLFRRATVLAFVSCLVVACSSSSSGDKTYSTTFTCTANGGTACPNGQECPKLPLGTGCGDLPGVSGHAPIKVDSDRPIGCRVGLPYGNAAYGDSQQDCTCGTIQPTDAPRWTCPL